ncbi:hypothetical protein ACLKA6_010565 [Drosophila palustris]
MYILCGLLFLVCYSDHRLYPKIPPSSKHSDQRYRLKRKSNNSNCCLEISRQQQFMLAYWSLWLLRLRIKSIFNYWIWLQWQLLPQLRRSPQLRIQMRPHRVSLSL